MYIATKTLKIDMTHSGHFGEDKIVTNLEEAKCLKMSRGLRPDIELDFDSLKNLYVYDEMGNKIRFSDIYRMQKTIIILTRVCTSPLSLYDEIYCQNCLSYSKLLFSSIKNSFLSFLNPTWIALCKTEKMVSAYKTCFFTMQKLQYEVKTIYWFIKTECFYKYKDTYILNIDF